ALGDRVPRATEQARQDRGVGPQTEVDDAGAVVDDPLDAGGDVVVAGARAAREHPGHDELGAGRRPGHAPAVVGDGGRDPADVGAVPVDVLGAAGAGELGPAGVYARRALHDLAGEVLVVEVDAGVD